MKFDKDLLKVIKTIMPRVYGVLSDLDNISILSLNDIK